MPKITSGKIDVWHRRAKRRQMASKQDDSTSLFLRSLQQKKKKEKRKREKLMMLNKPNGQPRRNQRRQLEAHSAFFCQFPSPNGETICSYWKTVEPCCFRYGFDDVLLGSYLTFLGEILGNCFFSVIYISSIFGHQICSG